MEPYKNRFQQLNNSTSSHKRGKRWASISAGLFMILGSTVTPARADTNSSVDRGVPNTSQTQLNDNQALNYQLQEPNYSIVNETTAPNLSMINKRAYVLQQNILMEHLLLSPRFDKSFNASQVLNQKKTFRANLAPQTLRLPQSIKKNRSHRVRTTFFIKLQILTFIYVILQRFAKLTDLRKKKRSHLHHTLRKTGHPIRQKKRLKVTITFHDVYGELDGLKTPMAVTKMGPFNGTYRVTAPRYWVLNSSQTVFKYRDGNQTVDVVPVYRGLPFKYNCKTKALEFTGGTLKWTGFKPFLSDNVTPRGISARNITTVKFNRKVNVATTDLSEMFAHASYLRNLDLSGLRSNHQQIINVRDMLIGDKSLRVLTVPKDLKLKPEMLGRLHQLYGRRLGEAKQPIEIFDGQAHPGTWQLTTVVPKTKRSVNVTSDDKKSNRNNQYLDSQLPHQAETDALDELSSIIGSLDSGRKSN